MQVDALAPDAAPPTVNAVADASAGVMSLPAAAGTVAGPDRPPGTTTRVPASVLHADVAPTGVNAAPVANSSALLTATVPDGFPPEMRCSSSLPPNAVPPPPPPPPGFPPPPPPKLVALAPQSFPPPQRVDKEALKPSSSFYDDKRAPPPPLLPCEDDDSFERLAATRAELAAKVSARPRGVVSPSGASATFGAGYVPASSSTAWPHTGCCPSEQTEEAIAVFADRVGADVAEGLLSMPFSTEAPDVIRRCCVCFEDVRSSDLRCCGRPDCAQSAYCMLCLKRHAETVVHDGLYAVPFVRCPAPSCNRRLGTEAWSPLVGEQTLTKYRENARALLTYRCAACDESGSYFMAAGTNRDPFTTLDPEVRQRILDAWRKYFLAEKRPEDFVEAVLSEYSCSHRSGGPPPAKLAKVFGASGCALWIADLERRLAVQLAWLHRFPRQRTLCCLERFCFRCKISSWHRGVSCQERLHSEKARQAQLCPGCGVPTQRSEGCRKITCVCGRVWEWEGEDGSEDGAFSDDASDDEVNQAQSAINLVAMNTHAEEVTVKEGIKALVDANADVNIQAGQTATGIQPALHPPLLVAVQCRHLPAVSALCEHGAKVTAEVLEEVKLVSHEEKRHAIEELFRPQIQGGSSMKLPLWSWVQAGSIPAVEALLRNAAHEEEIGQDVLMALHRCKGSPQTTAQIQNHIREHVGEERYKQLEASAASRQLLMELRQALDEERSIDVNLVRAALDRNADPDAREESGDDEDHVAHGDGLTGLCLVAMNNRATTDSVTRSIEALLQARANVNVEAEEASTPLQAALRHRNMPAVRALLKGDAKFTADILDEFKTLSEATRRRDASELLRGLIHGTRGRQLPLWYWVQDGSAQAVEALLRLKGGEDQVDIDTAMALQRCRADEQTREKIRDLVCQRIGEQKFSTLQVAAATRRLLQELREAYDDQRSVSILLLREIVDQGGDPNAQEEDTGEFDEEVGAYSQTALQLLVTNIYVSRPAMKQAVTVLVDAKADVNLDVSDTPLLAAVQHRCVAGVEALCQHKVRVTPDVLEEVKSLSGLRVRHEIEDALRPLIEGDRSLRVPLWMWVQAGGVTAVEALLRNSRHDEEVDTDVLVALQRCRGDDAGKQQISDRIREHVGEEEFRRLTVSAATRRLLNELRDAHSEERAFDLAIVQDALALGANANAREEGLDDEGLEDEEAEEEGEDDEEASPEGDEEEDAEGDEEEEDKDQEQEALKDGSASDEWEEEPEEDLEEDAGKEAE